VIELEQRLMGKVLAVLTVLMVLIVLMVLNACCFTLKLPSATPVTRTTPSHLAQALLRRCSGNDQRNRQTWFR